MGSETAAEPGDCDSRPTKRTSGDSERVCPMVWSRRGSSSAVVGHGSFVSFPAAPGAVSLDPYHTDRVGPGESVLVVVGFVSSRVRKRRGASWFADTGTSE